MVSRCRAGGTGAGASGRQARIGRRENPQNLRTGVLARSAAPIATTHAPAAREIDDLVAAARQQRARDRAQQHVRRRQRTKLRLEAGADRGRDVDRLSRASDKQHEPQNRQQDCLVRAVRDQAAEAMAVRIATSTANEATVSAPAATMTARMSGSPDTSTAAIGRIATIARSSATSTPSTIGVSRLPTRPSSSSSFATIPDDDAHAS